MNLEWGYNHTAMLRRAITVNNERGTVKYENGETPVRCQRDTGRNKIIPEGNQFMPVSASSYTTTTPINVFDQLDKQTVRVVDIFDDPQDPESFYNVAWTW